MPWRDLVVHRHGERTPVSRRLEKWIPPVWFMCATNENMFNSIETFQDKGIMPSPGKLEKVRYKKSFEYTPPGTKTPIKGDGACFYGQLTNVGRHSMSKLGENLRQIYVDRLHYLPETWSPNTLLIRSTDYSRTHDSVIQLVSGGLYPEGTRGKDFEVQVYTRERDMEILYPNPNCKRLRVLAKEFHAAVAKEFDPTFKKAASAWKDFVSEVSLDSHPSASGLLDTIYAAKAHGIPLPKGLDDEQLFRELESSVTAEWFRGYEENAEMRRLGMGPLLGAMREHMVNKVEGKSGNLHPDTKAAIYSGHDTTVAPLVISLGGFDGRWPPFSSSVVIELLQDTTQSTSSWTSWLTRKSNVDSHYVRVRYNDKLLNLPGCQAEGKHHANGDKSLCTLKAFLDIVEEQVPKNWVEECKVVS
ncbi:hypothetical protein BZG36_02461 [Bifiguratus adelaidae]|uniref:3-phytase n=1 Tax=Bifiguratus adelaidae TaxID=1938954 RepID=A0A261Y3L7_9FUNG|nr:hypothetical protein BZG36_02461 [Bifiguratus adelaidae]